MIYNTAMESAYHRLSIFAIQKEYFAVTGALPTVGYKPEHSNRTSTTRREKRYRSASYLLHQIDNSKIINKLAHTLRCRGSSAAVLQM